MPNEKFLETPELASVIEASAEGKIPGAAALMMAYNARVEALRCKYPNIVLVPKLEDFPLFLERYNLCAADVMKIFPWAHKTLQRYFPKLPFIMMNQRVRLAFPELLKKLPEQTQKARYLFSREDLLDFFHQELESDLVVARVPISLFVSNPEAFREDFVAEKRSRLLAKKGKLLNHGPGAGSVLEWESLKAHLSDNNLQRLRIWEQSFKEALYPTGKEYCITTAPKLRVAIPDDVLPIFVHYEALAAQYGCTSPTAGYKYAIKHGWVTHRLKDSGIKAFTKGPLIGTETNWPDYRVGATAIVLAVDAEKHFGKAQVSQNPKWRLAKEEIFWQSGTFTADLYQTKPDIEWLYSTQAT